jgi:Fe-S oxidoreductase
MFGPEIVRAFRELKEAADPQYLLNPGKILDPLPMDSNLRFASQKVDSFWMPVMSFQAHSGAGQETGPVTDEPPGMAMLRAVEMCNGAGVCRKFGGVMCPSFQVTREEMHSTRGRANLLRALFTGQFSTTNQLDLGIIHEALDLCLACKGCKSECPSGVDMAKLKYEFLDHYHGSIGARRPLSDYLFAHAADFARLGTLFQPFSNKLLRIANRSKALKKRFNVSNFRSFPLLSPSPLGRCADRLFNDAPAGGAVFPQKVLFLSDPFTEYFHPDVGLSALRALSIAGYQAVRLPVIGAGRTLISKGFLKAARRHASRVVDAITRFDPEGALWIVGVEPSELYTLKDEYLALFPDDDRVHSLSTRSLMIDEFLVRRESNASDRLLRIADFRTESGLKSSRILLHGHCYQKTQLPNADGYPVGIEATRRMLEGVGHSVQVIDSGCCGMAGAFGYETEHYDLSLRIGELALFPMIRAADPDTTICAAGFSCLTQIEDGTHRNAAHPISMLIPCKDDGS